MKVLLLGSGGREHALYWKLSQSPLEKEIRVFPGNGGIPESALVKNRGHDSEISLSDPDSIAAYVRREKYDLLIPGPEQPLVEGVVDAVRDICPVFGPPKAAARLEGSKDFAKGFMNRYGIPTAAAQSFQTTHEALAYLQTREMPIVIKADGLAAGKGVTVATDLKQAETAVRDALDDRIFGEAGARVLIEDFLEGEEVSVFALCDGKRALPFIAAQDHKRAYDFDLGPNTGGMGAYCPAPIVDEALMSRIRREILDPVIDGMQEEGSPYIGLLYAGLMIGPSGPKVVEYNVRFGDPETQALLPLLDEDLLELMDLAARGSLPDRPLRFRDAVSIVVVLAAQGYPGEYKKNISINLDSTKGDIICFHAGTKTENGRLLSSGGRILGVTALGTDLEKARKTAYAGLENIGANDVFYRKDIGSRAL